MPSIKAGRVFNFVFAVLCLACVLPASYIMQPTSGGGGYSTIQDEGTPLTQRLTFNCVGSGITCSDDSKNGVTLLTVLGGGGSSIVHAAPVQVAQSSTSLTTTYHFNVTSGNILVVGWGWENGANTNSSCTDTVGTTFTRIAQLTGDTNANGALFVGPANGSGADTVTCVLPSGGGFEFMYIAEFLPTQLTTTVDGTAAVRDSLGLQITTTRAGDTVFCVNHGTSSSGTFSGQFSFQTGIYLSGNDSGLFNMSNLLAEIAGVYNVGLGSTNNAHWSTICAALEGP